MKKKSAALAPAEIRAGVNRLMSSAYMKSPAGRQGDAGPSLFPFAEKWGLEGQVPGIIHELGFALLMERTTPEELFRLGTSEEAIRLLEEFHARWVERCEAAHAEHSAKAAEAGA
jgi:hypothetical protein